MDDFSSVATDLETVKASNVRRMTLSPVKTIMANNETDWWSAALRSLIEQFVNELPEDQLPQDPEERTRRIDLLFIIYNCLYASRNNYGHDYLKSIVLPNTGLVAEQAGDLYERILALHAGNNAQHQQPANDGNDGDGNSNDGNDNERDDDANLNDGSISGTSTLTTASSMQLGGNRDDRAWLRSKRGRKSCFVECQGE